MLAVAWNTSHGAELRQVLHCVVVVRDLDSGGPKLVTLPLLASHAADIVFWAVNWLAGDSQNQYTQETMRERFLFVWLIR